VYELLLVVILISSVFVAPTKVFVIFVAGAAVFVKVLAMAARVPSHVDMSACDRRREIQVG